MPDSDTKILVLGSGIVARPCVEYPVRSLKNVVIVACRTLFLACSFISGLPHMNVLALDVFSPEDLDYASSRLRPNPPASCPAYAG
jgi:saccharopine dehydrogenase-like NADP-dependent oxidoreductase